MRAHSFPVAYTQSKIWLFGIKYTITCKCHVIWVEHHLSSENVDCILFFTRSLGWCSACNELTLTHSSEYEHFTTCFRIFRFFRCESGKFKSWMHTKLLNSFILSLFLGISEYVYGYVCCNTAWCTCECLHLSPFSIHHAQYWPFSLSFILLMNSQ